MKLVDVKTASDTELASESAARAEEIASYVAFGDGMLLGEMIRLAYATNVLSAVTRERIRRTKGDK